jgi:hypothetical protein
MVPSVKILALKVNFSVSTEVRMLASVLRCFPNNETLHVEVKTMHTQSVNLAFSSYQPLSSNCIVC